MTRTGLSRRDQRPLVSGIDHIALRVHDLNAMVTFYTEVLGLNMDRRRDEIGLVHLRAGGSLIDLVAIDGVVDRPADPSTVGSEGFFHHLCLSARGFDQARAAERLLNAGVPSDPPVARYGAAGDGLSIYFRDPEGNALELRGAKE